MIYSSQTVRLVSHCFTNRASRTSRTGRGLVYTPNVAPKICSSKTTTCKFHDPYKSYESGGSWTSIYTPSPSNDMQFTNCTTRKPLFHDRYKSYELYGSWTCIYTPSLSIVMQFTNCTIRKPLSNHPYESYKP